jgi:hypothetical protein
MRNSLIASAFAVAVLSFGSAAYAESGGWTSQDQEQVYQTSAQATFEPSEITASIRAPHNAFSVRNDNSQNIGRDLTNTTEGN